MKTATTTSISSFTLTRQDGTVWEFKPEDQAKPVLLVFFETDCPTCRLTLPYLNRLADILQSESDRIVAISQDDDRLTRQLVEQLSLRFPVFLDSSLTVSRLFDPVAVPALFMVDPGGQILDSEIGFDKLRLNSMASALISDRESITIAEPHDGVPDRKPGCSSRHLEKQWSGESVEPVDPYAREGVRASRIRLDEEDPYEYCRRQGFADPLPVVPPTLERVEKMLEATPLPAEEIVALVPPRYGQATVEKIAANAVMAGCDPEMMEVLVPLVRAACDEQFNLHGVQATTHFAAPLVIVNGPVRRKLGFASGSNLFSNVAPANSTLGRALQLVLLNLGGARPGEIDMSTLGNPGKFSYCIAENEEENPWEPLHVEKGFEADQSTLTLFAAESPRGVSEHVARTARGVLRAVSRTLVTIWSSRMCAGLEALLILCPEHVKTLHRDGFRKQDVREFLFDNTGVPIGEFQHEGEGKQLQKHYEEVVIDGEPCYRKFKNPEQIHLVVAGGRAGKFSVVIGSWATGPRGSQMVTYPIEKGRS